MTHQAVETRGGGGPALCNGPGIFFVFLSLWTATARAQHDERFGYELSGSVEVDEMDSFARAQLEQVDACVADGQWQDAVETLRQVMENHGEQVASIDDGRYVSLRQYCQGKIAALPAEALENYRIHADPLARKWYHEGVAQRDANRLTRLVDRFFCSDWGDDALFTLGEMALERGWYGAARGFWTRISPQAVYELKTSRGGPLHSLREVGKNRDRAQRADRSGYFFPDTDLNLADLCARLVLVSIREGALDRAREELEQFRSLYPHSKGTWGGLSIVYEEELASRLEQASQWPSRNLNSGWVTFGGGSTRNRWLPRAGRIHGRVWKKALSLLTPSANPRAAAPTADSNPVNNDLAENDPRREMVDNIDELLGYHPLVVGDLILVNNQTRVFAFDIHTGRPAWGQEDGVIYADTEMDSFPPQRHRARLGVPRYTMTAHENRLYVRMGDPITNGAVPSNSFSRPSYLVCLDLASHGRLLWKASPPGDRWAFEGSPVTDGTYVYAGMRHSDIRPQAYVTCFDARSGKRSWQRFVCSAETPAQGQFDEISHNLLTLAEDSLYYNTNLGVVAAMSARNGHIRWISRYYRAPFGKLARRAAHFSRDLNPCIYFRGQLVVAPSDCEEIFALDAATGERLWSTSLANDAVHMLGICEGNLIASGDRLWWIDVRNGNVVWRWPEGEKAGVRGYGRGVLVADEIFWPTRDAIRILACRPTQQTRETREAIRLDQLGARAGNLLVVDGYLLIAASSSLYAIACDGRTIPKAKEALTGHKFTHRGWVPDHDRLTATQRRLPASDVVSRSFNRNPDHLTAVPEAAASDVVSRLAKLGSLRRGARAPAPALPAGGLLE